jgi:hypothetical protein
MCVGILLRALRGKPLLEEDSRTRTIPSDICPSASASAYKLTPASQSARTRIATPIVHIAGPSPLECRRGTSPNHRYPLAESTGWCRPAGWRKLARLFSQGADKTARIAEPEFFVQPGVSKICIHNANSEQQDLCGQRTRAQAQFQVQPTRRSTPEKTTVRGPSTPGAKIPDGPDDGFLATRPFQPQLQPSTGRDRRARFGRRHRAGRGANFGRRLPDLPRTSPALSPHVLKNFQSFVRAWLLLGPKSHSNCCCPYGRNRMSLPTPVASLECGNRVAYVSSGIAARNPACSDRPRPDRADPSNESICFVHQMPRPRPIRQTQHRGDSKAREKPDSKAKAGTARALRNRTVHDSVQVQRVGIRASSFLFRYKR